MSKKFLLTFSTLMISSILLCGCGQTAEEKELQEFASAMTSFTQNITTYNENINSIDPENNEAVTDFLNQLDQLNLEFETLSEIPIPDQYQSISDLASEASENMENAVSYYHTAFESNPFSTNDADIAYQYYSRAMTRVKYIGYVLSGEIPDDENVTVEEETSESLLIEKLLEKGSQTTTGEILDDLINQ